MNVLALIFYAGLATARGYSVNLGVEATDAHAVRGTVGGRANARFGLGIDFDLAERWTVSTGTDYVFRRVNWRRADDALVRIDFDYVDVPLTVRYRAFGIVSGFAGLRAGINVSDKPEVSAPTASFDPRARAIIALAEIGVRADLDARWSIDAYCERELGEFAADLREYRALGLRGRYGF